MKTRLALVAVVLGLALTGCSSDSDKSDKGPDVQTVEVPGQKVSFELPADWERFGDDKIADEASSVDEIAAKMGVSSEQLHQMITSVDVFMVAPRTSAEFVTNVNALHFPGPMPSQDGLEQQYNTLGATDLEVTKLTTDVGDGFRVAYHLGLNGKDLHQTAVIVLHNGVILDFTVSALDADDSGDIADSIASSLAETD